ncbi:ribonuclease VapC [Planctomycetales bacterium]|nr:ribonuclease VapC [Planctomycetales bacterium]
MFIDTNILVYAHIEDEPVKSAKAKMLIREQLANDEIVVSVQVLNEFYANLAKPRFNTPHAIIVDYLSGIVRSFTVSPLNLSTVSAALRLKERYGYSWWDSLILAAALESDCEKCYSEDMQDGQLIENRLTVVNPLA